MSRDVYKKRPLAERFWEKVIMLPDLPGCWLWTGHINKDTGYGQIGVSAYKLDSSHRVAYELEVGPIPEGKCVLHRCDVRACVNPSHLFIGTKYDNTQDMMAKGRHGYTRFTGEVHGQAKLTSEQVLEIRRRIPESTLSELAREYGMSFTAIWSIVRRRTWREI